MTNPAVKAIAIVVIIVIVVIAIHSRNKLLNLIKANITEKQLKEMMRSVAIIIVTILVLNLIVSQTAPAIWGIWEMHIFLFNIGIFIASFLITIKEADNNTNQTAQKASTLIFAIVAIGFISTWLALYKRGDMTEEQYATKKEVEKLLEEEPVFSLIADCEKSLDTAEKVKEAIQEYKREGAQRWIGSSKCWARKLNGQTLNLRTVEVGNEWSEWVDIPSIQGYEVFISLENIKEGYVFAINGEGGDNGRTFEKGTVIDGEIRSICFKNAEEGKKFKLDVEVRKRRAP